MIIFIDLTRIGGDSPFNISVDEISIFGPCFDDDGNLKGSWIHLKSDVEACWKVNETPEQIRNLITEEMHKTWCMEALCKGESKITSDILKSTKVKVEKKLNTSYFFTGTIYCDDEDRPIEKAIEVLTDEFILAGQCCDQTTIDLRDALRDAVILLRSLDVEEES